MTSRLISKCLRTSPPQRDGTQKTGLEVIVKQRPYRIPEARRQAIEDEVQQMLKLGVIEPSCSPWSSPFVLVPKPDGTLRFCNDFCHLNEVSEFDGYPMPRVDELLERLGRARYISTLDLTKGYWQVPLSDSAKVKTAFSTPSGHWQYRTLPVGLHRAPATFQRLMDTVLWPHQQYAAGYLDDVVIHSERWEDHLDRLWRVFMELRRAGLAANPRKCHLALFEARYLGFRVGRGLIKPQERKVEAVRAAPRPSTKTQVRAFLGLAGYYRCFIPNFSSLAAPLTDLTRKGQPECVVWSPETEKAFQRIKSALTEEPVLRAPDFGCPFLLQTDASETGLGAVLSQVQEGEEHPILFISRKLTSAEKNYATVEKEALAIKWAVLELRYQIKSNQITFIVTSPQHKCLGEWNSYERAPDSAKKPKQQFTYGQYIFTDCTEDNVQNRHTYTQYTQCTIKTYFVTNAPIHIIHRIYTSALCPHLCIVICEGATDYNLQ